MKNILADILRANSTYKDKPFYFLNLSIPVLAGVYVFASPLPLPSVNEFCFYLSCGALIILLYFRKTGFSLRSPLTLPLMLFFLWSVVGLFFTLDFANTLHDLRRHLLEYIILYYLLINYFDSSKKLEALSWIVIISTTVFSLGLLIHYYFIAGYSFTDRLGYLTHYIHTNHIGFLTVSSITLATQMLCRKKTFAEKLIFSLCIIVLGMATFLTQSRGSLFGLVTAIVIICFSNKKNVFFLAAILLLIMIAPGVIHREGPDSYTMSIRTKINHLTMEIIKEHSVTGIGFGMEIYGNEALVDLKKYNSRLPLEFQQKDVVKSPHNILLDITVRTGMVGLMLYLYVIGMVLFMLWRSFRRTENEYYRSWIICLLACFASFMVSSLFEDAQAGKPAVIYYTLLAMMGILWRLVQKDSESRPEGLIPDEQT